MAEYILSLIYDIMACAKRHMWLYVFGAIMLVVGLIVGIGIVDADKEIIIISSSGTLVVNIVQGGSFIWVLGRQLLVTLLIILSLYLLSFCAATNYIKLVLVLVIAIMGGVNISIVCNIYSILPSIIMSLLIVAECLLLSIAVMQSICSCLNCNNCVNCGAVQLLNCNISSALIILTWIIAKMTIIFVLIRLFFVIF